MELFNHDDEIYHHGIKGQRWGIRRFQTKDGALTPRGQKRYNKEMDKLKAEKKKLRNEERTKKKMAKLDDMKSDVEKMKKGSDDDKPIETPEQKRERLLKSTNPKELYENRELLSTFELNERINRIDTEARLQGKIVEEKQQTGLDYVNDKMQSAKRTLDNVTNVYKSIDNAYNSVANSAIGKTLAKQLGVEPPKKEFNLDEFWNNRNKKTTQEMMDVNKRLMAEDAIENRIKTRKEKAEAEKAAEKAKKEAEKAEKEAYAKAKKQVDDYNTPWEDREGSYSKKGSDLNWTKTATAKDGSGYLRLEQVDRYEATGRDVIGKGTSRYNSRNDGPIIDADYREVVTNYPAVVSRGERSYNNVIALLEDKRMKHSDTTEEFLIQNGLEHSMNQSLDELYHYGIKGMKWGVHRFYNKDGSRTAAGKKRENEAKRFGRKKISKKNLDAMKKDASQYGNLMSKNADREANNAYHKAKEALRYNTDYKNKNLSGYSPGSIRKPYSSDEIYEFAKKGYDKLIESDYHKKLKDAIDSGKMIAGEDYIYNDMVMEFTKTGADKSKKLYDSAKRSRNRNRFIDLDYYRTATSYDE